MRALAALALLLAGCASGGTVHGDADGVWIPTMRGVRQFGRATEAAGPVRGLVGLDFGLSGADDEFATASPLVSDTRFQLIDAHFAFRGGIALEERVRFEGLVGMEYSHFEVDFAPAGFGLDSEDSDNFGPMVGGQMTIQVAEPVSLFGRITVAAGAPETETEKVEVGGLFHVTEGFRLLVAYRWWQYREDDVEAAGGASYEFDLEIEGLLFGAEVWF